MQFLAALFEHFIVGIFTIFCFTLFYIKNSSCSEIDLIKDFLSNTKELVAIALLPISYLIGIYLDAISSLSLKVISLCLTELTKRMRGVDNRIKSILDKVKSKVLNGNSYKRTIEILRGEELQRYFLQLNSRLKVTRGVVPIPVISFIYSWTKYGFLDKYTCVFLILSVLSICTYRWHYSLMETFKSNFKASQAEVASTRN